MLYGVEQSTDMRCKKTVIKKFTSKTQALKWKENSGKFTYDDPGAARNWHHTFRELYELEGRINKKDSIFSNRGSYTYPRNTNDNIANYLYVYGFKVKEI